MIADMVRPAVFLNWDEPSPDLGLLDLETIRVPSMLAAPAPVASSPAALFSGPPAYSAILREMLGRLDEVRVYRLWQDIFGEDRSGNLNRERVEIEFMERVRCELFEFDLLGAYDIVYHDETSLAFYIPVTGYRIPWETGDIEDLPTWQQFLAITMISCQDPNALMYDDRPGYFGDIAIPRLDWLDESLDDLQERAQPHLVRLSNLPAPFDALAVLIAGALDLCDNLFLALPAAEFRLDYTISLELTWDPSVIRYLAAEYDRALPAILRIKAFESWFESQDEDGANQAVAAALAGEDLTPWLSQAVEVEAMEVAL